MSERPHKWILYLYMLGLMLSGGAISICLKVLNSSEAKGENFSHPFFIPFLFVIGDVLCFMIYLYEIRSAKKQYGSYNLHPKVLAARTNGKPSTMSPLYLAIPKLLNLAASCVMGMAYSYTFSESNLRSQLYPNYQKEFLKPTFFAVIERSMESSSNDENISFVTFELALGLQGFIAMVIVALSLLLIKRDQYRHHWVSVGFIFAATLLICIPLIINQRQTSLNVLIGIGLTLGSVVLFSLQYIIEEKLLTSYYLTPARVVGWQGFWGILYIAIFMPTFQAIECHARFCSNGRIEDSIFAFQQIYANVNILLLLVG